MPLKQKYVVRILECERHWRRVRDLNPRFSLRRTQHFECCTFDLSDNSPYCCTACTVQILFANVLLAYITPLLRRCQAANGFSQGLLPFAKAFTQALCVGTKSPNVAFYAFTLPSKCRYICLVMLLSFAKNAILRACVNAFFVDNLLKNLDTS